VKKASLVLAIMVMLAGVSVQAQKKSAQGRVARPIIQPQLVVIQDDNGGGFLLFDPASGAYKSSLCEYGYALSGRGQVKIDGCNVYFSDIQTGYRIFASVNMCEHQAKCAFEVFELPKVDFDIEPILESWTDTDMRNSTAECGALVSPK
jgi:hypothetical protein